MLTFVTEKKQRSSSRPHHESKNACWRPQQHSQVRQILRRSSVQPKLTIGAPNDKYEQEADRVAERVMRMPAPQLQLQALPEEEDEELIQAKQLSAQITPLLQRQVGNPEEEVDEEELLQAKYLPGHSISVTSGVAEIINGAPPQLQRT